MSVYMTEEEQLAAIKAWWKKYSNPILTALTIVLLVIVGFKYWYWHKEKITIQASSTYEHLIVAFSNQNNKEIQSYANQLITHYHDTVYADGARLILGKFLATEQQYDKALDILETVVTESKVQALKQLAIIRKTQLFMVKQAYDKALKELSRFDMGIYQPIANELKGDIYIATKEYEKASNFYNIAKQETNANKMKNLFLEMKANALSERVKG